MNELPPEVSIVMPCHNAAAHLAISVGSVLAQTYDNWELIAVDDGSSDGTLAWLQAQRDTRIRVFTQTNQGVSAARNAGLAVAHGRYVAFLDADDTWAPTFLEKMQGSLQSHPDAVLAYCGWQNVGLPGGRGEPFVPPDYENAAKTETLFAGCRWPIHACLTYAHAIRAAGGFDTRLVVAEDYLLWLEVATRGPIIRVAEVLAQYQHHDGIQATKNVTRSILDTLRAKQIFLAGHPEITAAVGHDRIHALTWGRLIQEANALYWRGDIERARPLFRKALLSGKGSLSEKLRMLPSLLPLWFHQLLLLAANRRKG